MEAPYTVNQLAHALQFLTEHPELVEKMDESDSMLMPEEENSSTWLQKLEQEQQANFEKLINNIKNNDQ